MAQTTRVYFCCSPNKRSGSTTTARLLIDYFLTRGPGALGFDTDPHDPRFREKVPRRRQGRGHGESPGPDPRCSTGCVHDETPKVVDVQHRFYDSFFETIGQIGFMEEARRAMVLPVALFHLDAMSQLARRRRRARRALAVFADGCGQKQRRRAAQGPTRGKYSTNSPTRNESLIGALDPQTWKTFDAPDFLLPEILKYAAGKHADGHTDKLEGMADADFPPIPAFRIGGLDGKHAVSVRGAGRGLATKARRAPPGSGEKVGAENIGPRQTRRRSAFPRSRARRRFRLDLDRFALGRNLRETAKSLATEFAAQGASGRGVRFGRRRSSSEAGGRWRFMNSSQFLANLPNLITLARLLMTPLAVSMIVAQRFADAFVIFVRGGSLRRRRRLHR